MPTASQDSDQEEPEPRSGGEIPQPDRSVNPDAVLMKGSPGCVLPPGGTLRPVVDFAEQLAKDLEPGGRYEAEGETLRYYDSELARLRAAGVPDRALRELSMRRGQVLAIVARRAELDRCLSPVQYVYELPTPEG